MEGLEAKLRWGWRLVAELLSAPRTAPLQHRYPGNAGGGDQEATRTSLQQESRMRKPAHELWDRRGGRKEAGLIRSKKGEAPRLARREGRHASYIQLALITQW